MVYSAQVSIEVIASLAGWDESRSSVLKSVWILRGGCMETFVFPDRFFLFLLASFQRYLLSGSLVTDWYHILTNNAPVMQIVFPN